MTRQTAKLLNKGTDYSPPPFLETTPSNMTPLFMKLGSALYFGLTSFSIQLVTKALFTAYHFNYPMCLALTQMSFASMILYGVARPAVTVKAFRTVGPLAVIYCMNIIFGLVGTAGLSLPMFIVVRRFTLLMTIILEFVWYNKTHPMVTYVSIGIMLSGACVAALYDLSFSLKGYAAVLMNDLLTASSLVMIKNSKEIKEISTNCLLFYTSTLAVPMLFCCALALGEFQTLSSYTRWNDVSFKLVFVGSSLLGLVLNHSQYLCTRVNEPIMTSVTGLVKNSVSTVAGGLLFDDYTFSFNNAMGVMLSMAGSVIYTIYSVRSSPHTNNKLVLDSKEKNSSESTPLLRVHDGSDVSRISNRNPAP